MPRLAAGNLPKCLGLVRAKGTWNQLVRLLSVTAENMLVKRCVVFPWGECVVFPWCEIVEQVFDAIESLGFDEFQWSDEVLCEAMFESAARRGRAANKQSGKCNGAFLSAPAVTLALGANSGA